MTAARTTTNHPPVALLQTDDAETGVPWLRIIRFHRAIVQRAEEGFWTMDAHKPDSERWTSLTGFEPADLDGPWPMDPAVMRSPAWSRQLELGQIDSMYLGGPGYLGRTTLAGQGVEEIGRAHV